jgi:hypothetical protein
MDKARQRKLEQLKARLQELRKHDPSHCSGTRSFTPHSIPPALFREIEEIEEQIKALEAQG